MVSQFVSSHEVRLLGDVNFSFPEGTHAVGRLDNLSEGLLLLTTNKKITGLLLKPSHAHTRTYHVKVKGIVSQSDVDKLQNGVSIRIKGGGWYTTTPAKVSMIQGLPTDQHLPQWPSSWLEIILTEGKFHQVRKMVVAVGHRCQRLVRMAIEDMQLGDLAPGEVMEMDEATFFRKLRI